MEVENIFNQLCTGVLFRTNVQETFFYTKGKSWKTILQLPHFCFSNVMSSLGTRELLCTCTRTTTKKDRRARECCPKERPPGAPLGCTFPQHHLLHLVYRCRASSKCHILSRGLRCHLQSTTPITPITLCQVGFLKSRLPIPLTVIVYN